MSGLQYTVGLKTSDRVILASDKSLFAYGALIISNDHDKTWSLGDKKLMLCTGEDGDVAQFSDFTQKNLELYRLRNGYEMGPKAAAYWIRKTIADNLRTRVRTLLFGQQLCGLFAHRAKFQDAYLVEVVVGGYDDHEKTPYLAVIDYLGNRLDNSPYVFRGFGGRLSMSIMDSTYRPEMTEEEALGMLRQCLQEMKKRFLANMPAFQVTVIDADGVRNLPDMVV